jgi:putative transposase
MATVWNDWQASVFIVKAATVIGWHRKGFRLFWAWKVRHRRPGRPAVPNRLLKNRVGRALPFFPSFLSEAV